MKQTLIIFIKNPILGTAKTRLAKDIGDEKALHIYQKLLFHTNDITKNILAEKHLYYNRFIDLEDVWSNDIYTKKLQSDGDLGNKMSQAFQATFDDALDHSVVIIGSDCYALTQEHFELAFETLRTSDIVIGPSEDGGYYLLGMNHFQSFLFENLPWSQPNLLEETLHHIKMNDLSVSLLPILNDIDTLDDLNKSDLQ